MRIAYYLSASAALAGELGGVRRNLLMFMELARAGGADVVMLDHSGPESLKGVDIVHLSPADLDTRSIARELRRRGIPYVVSPIIDKTAPDWVLRSVTLMDALFGRVLHSNLGAAREICLGAAGIAAMSNHEIQRVRSALGVTSCVIRRVQPPMEEDALQANARLFTDRFGAADFVLFVGDLGNRRKNVKRLIEACAIAELPLCLVGTLDRSTLAGAQVARAAENGAGVRYLGVLDRAMLLSGMAACRVFALPSLMEGIGLAAIDAAVAGASAVVTRNGGLQEYLGGYAQYVAPRSVRSIANGLRQAWLTRPAESERAALRERLSPARASRDLGDLYQVALRERT